MTISLEIRIRYLFPEFKTHAEILRRPFQTARTVSACFFQPRQDTVAYARILIESYMIRQFFFHFVLTFHPSVSKFILSPSCRQYKAQC